MTRDQFILQVKSSQEALRRFLAALCCGNMQQADDIAQETYIKAFMSADRLIDESKFKSWVLKIAYNCFLNCCRSEKVYADYTQAVDVVSDYTGDSAFRYQHLYQALDRLSENERMVLLLFYMEGYSVKEIAAIAGSSSDAVKQNLSRGRKHLRDIIT